MSHNNHSGPPSSGDGTMPRSWDSFFYLTREWDRIKLRERQLEEEVAQLRRDRDRLAGKIDELGDELMWWRSRNLDWRNWCEAGTPPLWWKELRNETPPDPWLQDAMRRILAWADADAVPAVADNYVDSYIDKLANRPTAAGDYLVKVTQQPKGGAVWLLTLRTGRR